MKPELQWGETPWDELSRDDLLREVQRMYAALVALNTTAGLCRFREEASPFWGTRGTGGRAIEHARQILEPLHAKYSSEQIFRSFFRYAVDLLFENLGSQWAVCDQCGQMLGTVEGQPSKIGEPCAPPFGCGKGVTRKLEWKDLAKADEPPLLKPSERGKK